MVIKEHKVEKIEKLTQTIKVSKTNDEELTALAGELQAIRKVKQTPNDAITRLFEIKKQHKGDKTD